MAYSDKEWETVRAFYERGLSLGDIAARPEVTIKDRATISKKASKEGWVKGEKATLLHKEIETKQNVAEISEKKATLNATELEVHNILVEESVKRMEWLNNAALKNVQEAMKASCENQQDYKHRADTVLKAKEAVFGKQPDTAIQINNATQARPAIDIEAYRLARVQILDGY